MEQGDNGTDTGEHADRTSSLAGVTTSIGLSVLAGALEFVNDSSFAKISEFEQFFITG